MRCSFLYPATLTGNPYPSALHLNAFLLDPANTAATAIAYFWQQDKNVNSHLLSAYRGGYASYAPVNLASSGIYTAAAYRSYNSDGTLNGNPSTGTSPVIERKYLPIGQGFLINGIANRTVTFKNSHRAYYIEGSGLSQFEKPAKDKDAEKKTDAKQELTPVSHFKINTIINNDLTRQLALAFIPEATDGIDRGIDARNMDESLPNDVSFWIENANYVIQGINLDLSKKNPLSVKASGSTKLKFYMSEIVNFDNSQKIYIYDSLDMSYHDIKNGTYEVSVVQGIHKERFKISFTNQSTLGINEENLSDFFITQDNQNQVLKVFNPYKIVVKSFVLFDISGRVVLSKNNIGIEQNYIFSTSALSSGVYIASFLTTENRKFTQKVIISNSGK